MGTISTIEPEEYKGEVKVVIETAYGLSIGIYDETANDYHDGCYVESEVVQRRTGLQLSMLAKINEEIADEAEALAHNLSSNPASLATTIQQAKTARAQALNISVEEFESTHNVETPTEDDLAVHVPEVR